MKSQKTALKLLLVIVAMTFPNPRYAQRVGAWGGIGIASCIGGYCVLGPKIKKWKRKIARAMKQKYYRKLYQQNSNNNHDQSSSSSTNNNFKTTKEKIAEMERKKRKEMEEASAWYIVEASSSDDDDDLFWGEIEYPDVELIDLDSY